MPPRIRTRASKALKENIVSENKIRNFKTNTKPPRKALADKTNSASDDTSVEIPKKEKVEVRSRRERRLPNRFVENPLLTNLSNNSNRNTTVASKNNAGKSLTPGNILSSNNTPAKDKETKESSFKTPSKVETSLVVCRPRRICRLPSRFEDHSISPNKYILIQPSNASTPKQHNKAKPPQPKKDIGVIQNKSSEKPSVIAPTVSTRSAKAATLQKNLVVNTSTDKSSPDSNNNAKARTARAKKNQPQTSLTKISPKLKQNNSINKFFNRTASAQTSPLKIISPKPVNKNLKHNNSSFKVLGGKKQEDNIDDIYEFTFDPNEEPLKQKKKRKKPVTKKPPKVTKPKAVVTYKSTYDQNISKALSALRKAVQPSKTAESAQLPQIQEISNEIAQVNNVGTRNSNTANKDCHVSINDTGKTSVHECNYPSIRVEDIAADIEPTIDHYDDINYSPVNSPRPKSPVANVEPASREHPERPLLHKDPLNLQEDLSFFDDVPVASSSMNMSVRHPLASPWRVEFGSLPIKWHSNTYVKPNMTPAVESSFICSEGSDKKKHVYTNMVPEANEPLPQIFETNMPNLKQTSIISFIKEVAERKAKKKRGRSVSPTKAMAILDNVDKNTHTLNQTEESNNDNQVANSNTSEDVSNNSNNLSDDKENSKEERKTRKRKNNENICDKPAKSPRKQKDKDCTYFGFDESENQDQENVSPKKAKDNVGRSLRSKSRVVLKEINGPARAMLPLAAKSKTVTSSEAINRVYEGLKSAADAPIFPEKDVVDNITNVEDPTLNDDSQSVHLFEDIDVVHHLKPTRKSYGKAKKVIFRQHSTSCSGSQEHLAVPNDTSFEDDLGDLTFEVPNIKEKKKTKKKPKKVMSKKEEKEAEEWAAGFNSMCEEIEDFPLVVE